MAMFYRIEDGKYINIDQITFLTYDKEKNKTVYKLSGINEILLVNGNIVEDILSKNNDVTMRDKLTCQYLFNKIRSCLLTIQTRLDMISREVRNGN